MPSGRSECGKPRWCVYDSLGGKRVNNQIDKTCNVTCMEVSNDPLTEFYRVKITRSSYNIIPLRARAELIKKKEEQAVSLVMSKSNCNNFVRTAESTITET